MLKALEKFQVTNRLSSESVVRFETSAVQPGRTRQQAQCTKQHIHTQLWDGGRLAWSTLVSRRWCWDWLEIEVWRRKNSKSRAGEMRSQVQGDEWTKASTSGDTGRSWDRAMRASGPGGESRCWLREAPGWFIAALQLFLTGQDLVPVLRIPNAFFEVMEMTADC